MACTVTCALIAWGVTAYAVPSYGRARAAADTFMAQFTDWPCLCSKGRFVLSCHPSGPELAWFCTPCWVFCYTNRTTGETSARVYVDLPEYRAYMWYPMLDPVPMLGCRP